MVKTNSAKPDIYNLKVRMCTNSSLQDAKLEDSHSSVYLVDSLCITVALKAAFSLSLSLTDIVNAYQNTILPLDKMPHEQTPPFYVEWFRSNFP